MVLCFPLSLRTVRSPPISTDGLQLSSRFLSGLSFWWRTTFWLFTEWKGASGNLLFLSDNGKQALSLSFCALVQLKGAGADPGKGRSCRRSRGWAHPSWKGWSRVASLALQDVMEHHPSDPGDDFRLP